MSKNLTVLGDETEFRGVMEFTDGLVILGSFEGTIKDGGMLEVGKTGRCSVDYARSSVVTVSGEIKGDIFASESLEMKSGSRIEGNVSTARLRICDNVEFEGQVSMLTEAPQADIFSVSGSEYKETLKVGSRFEADSPAQETDSPAEAGTETAGGSERRLLSKRTAHKKPPAETDAGD